MNHKVLLADDSPTIQKVIKITLANQPYEIVDAGSEDELFKKLSEVKPKIVFLDFNLSDKHTGYELTSKIKEISPKTKVLLLLGTFDSVDESTMSKCGASDKIVKPFDANKFTSICRRLAEEDEEVEEIKFPEPKVEEEAPVTDETSQWEMTSTKKEEIKIELKHFDVKAHLNPLDEEINSWGMSIPGVISGKESDAKTIDLPPVMNTTKKEKKAEVTSIAEHREAKADLKTSQDSIKYPDNSDLDYPTIEELTEKPATQTVSTPATSKLISIETFNENNFEIEHGINTADDSDVSKIEAQIRDEVEEDIWKIDEFEDLKKEVEAKFEEARTNFTPAAEEFEDTIEFNVDFNGSVQNTPVATNMSISQHEIEEMVKKYVKQYLDEYFKQGAEKVAWEVIPDLAENLIRQELTKISNRVLDE